VLILKKRSIYLSNYDHLVEFVLLLNMCFLVRSFQSNSTDYCCILLGFAVTNLISIAPNFFDLSKTNFEVRTHQGFIIHISFPVNCAALIPVVVENHVHRRFEGLPNRCLPHLARITGGVTVEFMCVRVLIIISGPFK
jgi:hypothetical protein